jgi:hypothetical protein
MAVLTTHLSSSSDGAEMIVGGVCAELFGPVTARISARADPVRAKAIVIRLVMFT